MLEDFVPNRTVREKKRRGSGFLRDKPVTFHSKVKSSGYGAPPVQTSKKKKKSRISIPSKTSTYVLHMFSEPCDVKSQCLRFPFTSVKREYPIHCSLPMLHQKANVPSPSKVVHNSPIHQLAFAPDASKIATCANDHTARVMRTPLSRFKGDGWSLIGTNIQTKTPPCRYSHNLSIHSP